jgi:MSHA biogenesis protein MshK
MAERLTGARVLCVLAAVAASPAVAAQGALPDPTRPPAASVDEGTRTGPARDTRPGHRVQSVLISPERKLAVIDGRTVLLGGRIDDATVVAITETGVTLRRGEQTEMLPLNAGVQKKGLQP